MHDASFREVLEQMKGLLVSSGEMINKYKPSFKTVPVLLLQDEAPTDLVELSITCKVAATVNV